MAAGPRRLLLLQEGHGTIGHLHAVVWWCGRGGEGKGSVYVQHKVQMFHGKTWAFNSNVVVGQAQHNTKAEQGVDNGVVMQHMPR